MSENNSKENNDLLSALNSIGTVNVGDVVKGEVLTVDDDKQVIVGIEGTGVEGVVPQKELAARPVSDIKDIVKVGDTLDLIVISKIGNDKEGGSYLLSARRLESRKIWDDIQKEYEDGKTITAPVTQVVKGGLVVDAGVRGFVPASMVSDHFVEDLNQFNGKSLEFKIIEIEPSENRLILSHRAILEIQKAIKREELMLTIKAGDIIEGVVARLTNFGAFVDLGGIDGLVHISEISYERVEKPSDFLKTGDSVQVKVLSVDLEKNRISLSIKQTLPEPWDGIKDKALVGDVLDGIVKRLTSFGAFVEVFPGVEGLVHISQIAHEHIATPNDVLKTGQKVQVKVLEVNSDDHRLALSIKALQDNPSTIETTVDPMVNDSSNYKENSNNTDSSVVTLGDIIGDQLKNNDSDLNT